MTFDDLAQWTNQIGAGKKLSAATKRRVEAELPGFIRDLNPESAPSRLRLPTGESLSNATRMTALKCQCLLLARNAFGADYVKADEEYERLAKDVLFWVMRHAFNSGDPKGIFLLPGMHHFAASAVCGVLLSLGRLRRTEIQCPDSSEGRYIGLCARTSEGVRTVGGERLFADEVLRRDLRV